MKAALNAIMNQAAPEGCAAQLLEYESATYNVCSSDVHLVVILLTLCCSRDLSFVLNLSKKKKAHNSIFTHQNPEHNSPTLEGICFYPVQPPPATPGGLPLGRPLPTSASPPRPLRGSPHSAAPLGCSRGRRGN